MEAIGVHAASSSPPRPAKRRAESDTRRGVKVTRGVSRNIVTADQSMRAEKEARKAANAVASKPAPSKSAPVIIKRTPAHVHDDAGDMHGNDSFEDLNNSFNDATPVKPSRKMAPVSSFSPLNSFSGGLDRRGGGARGAGASEMKSGPGKKAVASKTVRQSSFYGQPSGQPSRTTARRAATPEFHSDEENRTPRARLPALGMKRVNTAPSATTDKTLAQERRSALLSTIKFKKKGEAVPLSPQRERDRNANAFFAEMKNTLAPELQETIHEQARANAEKERLELEESERLLRGHKEMDKVTHKGNAFFESLLGQVDSPGVHSRLEKVTAALEAADSEAASIASTSRAPSPPPVNQKEEDICRPFRHPTDTCPYCKEPMPATATPHLKEMGRALKDAQRESGMKPSWQQTTSYCSQHRAETRTIPLGLTAGFPSTIDFNVLDRRLEEGFVRARLHRIVRRPSSSKFFLSAERDIAAHGITRWMDAAQQTVLAEKVTTGYYGDLGREVIIRHFQQLVNWGHLSLTSDHVHPVTVADFIVSVLAPEAAILLIMQDKGWTSDTCHGPEWKTARKTANSIRLASREFGQAKFRASSGVGELVLRQLEDGADAKRARLEEDRDAHEARIREKIGREKDGRQPIYVPSSSAHSTSDFSVSGDDERQASPDRTPLARKRVRQPKNDKPPSPRYAKSASQSSRSSSSQSKRRSGKHSSPIPVSPVKTSPAKARRRKTTTPHSSQEYGDMSWGETDFLEMAAAATDKAASSSRR